MFEFDYVEGEPIISAFLENEDKSLLLDFFVDSGADLTMIPLSFAKKLGFDNWTEEEIEDARDASGNSIPYFVRKANMIIENQNLDIDLACSILDDVPFLLGRKDIFDKFQVCFNDKEKKVRSTEL